jgi:hypothetical protein
MIYPIGTILLVKDYQYYGGIKDKFFIVLSESDGSHNLMAITTSQPYLNQDQIKHGNILDRDMSIYCFEANKIIGKSGFAFPKNTFVTHRNNEHKWNSERFSQNNVIVKDELIFEELNNLVYSFYTSKLTSKGLKKELEVVLERINAG